MNVPRIADRTVSVSRQTSNVLPATTATATMTPTRQPTRASLLNVFVAGGTTGSGTVAIAGTDADGAAISETLTFTANGVLRTTRRFLTVDTNGITTTGLADEATVPTIRLQAVDEGGSPVAIVYSVAATRPAVVQRTRGDWPANRQGSEEVDEAVILLDYEEVWTPQAGDLIDEDDSSDRWIARRVHLVRSGWLPSHYEVRATRRES